MKKLIAIVTLMFAAIGNSQDIIPTENEELCPNQEYTFTIYASSTLTFINGVQNATVKQGLQLATNGGAFTYTFKGRFLDAAGPHIFETNGLRRFTFMRVKNFWNTYRQNDYSGSVTAPICTATPINLNLSGQYELPLSNPITYYGNINRYHTQFRQDGL